MQPPTDLASACLDPERLHLVLENMDELKKKPDFLFPSFIQTHENAIDFLQRKLPPKLPTRGFTVVVTFTENIYDNKEQCRIVIHTDEPDRDVPLTEVGKPVHWESLTMMETVMQFRVQSKLFYKPQACVIMLCSLALSLVRDPCLGLDLEIESHVE